MGRYFHVVGITVNRIAQTVEDAVAGIFHIKEFYPLVGDGRLARIGPVRDLAPTLHRPA
jgi:hypothetical protein